MTTDPWSVLTEHQATVARAFLADRERERRRLAIYLSGAHAYGFPSPDSDLDLKCVHVAPTSDLVGITPVEDSPERIQVVDGVELDYGSNELAPVLRGIIKGNGNFLERILGDLILGGDAKLLAEARTICRPLLSRRIVHHYRGFANSQLKLFDEKPTAKRALYVLRTAATGRHLLAHGEVITDVSRLTAFVPAEIEELHVIKRRAERQQLQPERVSTWRERLASALAAIDSGYATSILPPEPPADAIASADEWLREVRRTSW
ncbi:nucleotidyltransferase domain-containing protein [soil metagenome]